MGTYEFWFSDKHGLIRRRSGATTVSHPEVWRDGYWRRGSPYVVDAIVGMGEDPWSCGEWADAWDKQQADTFAAANGIDLFAAIPQTVLTKASPTMKITTEKSLAAQPMEEQSPAPKALHTAKWARIMTKWMINH